MSSAFTATELLTTFGPAIAGSLLGGASGGGAQGGTQTMNKDPWLPAQDWMKSNLATGQNLQNYYQKNPFNQQQQAAYGNLASGADYMNRLTPGLLHQFSQPAAFDRSNPRAMPSPFSFMAPDNPQNAHQYGGMMQRSAPVGGERQQSTAENFNAQGYLSQNPDVAGDAYFSTHPLEHFQKYGTNENRFQTSAGQFSNPFTNGGVQQSPQAGMPDIQKMVNDALAAQRQYTQPIDTNIGGGGNGG